MDKYNVEKVRLKPILVPRQNDAGQEMAIIMPLDAEILRLIENNHVSAAVVVVNRTQVRLLVLRNSNMYLFRPSTKMKEDGAGVKLRYIMDFFGDGTLSVSECLRLIDRFEMRPDRMVDMDGSVTIQGKNLKYGERLEIEFRSDDVLKRFFSQ